MPSPCWREQQDAALQALSVALQHPAICQDSRVVCRLSQVCHSWHVAVQTSTAGQLAVSCHLCSSMGSSLRKVSSLAAWLPRYAGLCGELTIWAPCQPIGVELHKFGEAAEHVLACSIRQAVAGAPITCSINIAATCSPTLRLRRFTATDITKTVLVNALPVDSLTYLRLEIVPHQPHSSQPAAWAAALGRLTGLRELSVSCIEPGIVPRRFAAHFSNLVQLTKLELCGFNLADDCSAVLQQLPQSLQYMELRSFIEGYSADGVLQLQQLTNLTRLDIDLEGDGNVLLTAAPVFPTLLKELNVDKDTCGDGHYTCLPSIGMWDLTALQQLTKLHISGNAHVSTDITPLTALTGLQELALCYDSTAATVAAAPAWKQLPELHDLEVKWEQDAEDPATSALELGNLLQDIAAATSLTRLACDLAVLEGARLEVCRHLTGLTTLQGLSFEGLGARGVLVANDALHLSVLRGLTHLSFGLGCPSGVGDMVAVALACQLTNMQCWELTECGLQTAAVVPAIAAHQKQLTRLFLGDNLHKFTENDVAMLTRYGVDVLRGSYGHCRGGRVMIGG